MMASNQRALADVLLGYLLVLTLVSTSVGDDILIIGDSMGEGSGTLLADHCRGKAVVNRAIGGTTADQWGSPAGEVDCWPDCSAQFAFEAGSGFTHVWLSVGGNDWLGAGCRGTTGDLKSAVQRSIDHVLAQDSSVKILMTGYAYPSSDEECPEPGDLDPLQAALQAQAAANPPTTVTFVDIRDIAGGSSSSWSSLQYFADSIHLNKAGYEKLFTLPEVQSFFGCPDSAPSPSPGPSPAAPTAAPAAPTVDEEHEDNHDEEDDHEDNHDDDQEDDHDDEEHEGVVVEFGCLCEGGRRFEGSVRHPDFDGERCIDLVAGVAAEIEASACAHVREEVGDEGLEAAQVCCEAAAAPTSSAPTAASLTATATAEAETVGSGVGVPIPAKTAITILLGIAMLLW